MFFQRLRNLFGDSDEQKIVKLTHDPQVEIQPLAHTDQFSLCFAFFDAIEREKVERAGVILYPTFEISHTPISNGSADARLAIQLLGLVLYALFSGRTMLPSDEEVLKLKSPLWLIIKEMIGGRATVDIVRLRMAVNEVKRRQEQRTGMKDTLKREFISRGRTFLIGGREFFEGLLPFGEGFLFQLRYVLPVLFAVGIVATPIFFDVMNGSLSGGALGFIGGFLPFVMCLVCLAVFFSYEEMVGTISPLFLCVVSGILFAFTVWVSHGLAGCLPEDSRSIFVLDRKTGTYVGYVKQTGDKRLVTNLGVDWIEVKRYTTVEGFPLTSEFVVSDDTLKMRVAYTIDEALLLKNKDRISSLLQPSLSKIVAQTVEKPLKSYLVEYRAEGKKRRYDVSSTVTAEELLLPNTEKKNSGKEAALLTEKKRLLEGAARILRDVKLPGDGAITVKITGLDS